MSAANEDKKGHEVRSTQFEYDMAPWASEKSGNVLRFLADLVDKIASLEISDEQREELSSGLGAAIYDATKVLSFAAGAHWETKDADLIRNNGTKGFEELRKKYAF